MDIFKSRLVPFAFIVGLVVPGDACSEKEYGLDEQEFLCDDASSHITECCGSAPAIYCTREYGCNHRDTMLSSDDSLCIRESSCEAIKESGLCRINNWQISYPSSESGSTGSAAFIALRALSCY